jgi:hypothetical protein
MNQAITQSTNQGCHTSSETIFKASPSPGEVHVKQRKPKGGVGSG